MSKTRIKLSLGTIRTREDAETVLGEIAVITINKTRTLAQMDGEIAAIRKNYEANLAAYDKSLAEKTRLLADWAEINRDTAFPKKAKSITFVQGTLGFRTSNPSVVLTGRAWSWDKVLATLQALRWRKFVRIKREVDKEAILARYAKAKDQGKFDTFLARCGLKIKQDETFFVDPNVTENETRQTTSIAA